MSDYPNGGYRRSETRRLPTRFTDLEERQHFGIGGPAADPWVGTDVDQTVGFQGRRNVTPSPYGTYPYDEDFKPDYYAYRGRLQIDVPFTIGEYDDPRHGGVGLDGGKGQPPTDPRQRVWGGWQYIPARKLGRWNWLLQIMLAYYEYLNNLYGAKAVNTAGWTISCGAPNGIMVGGPSGCGPNLFISGNSYRANKGHAVLSFGNWWAHFRDPLTEVQFPGDTYSHTVVGAMFKPDTGPVESPYPYFVPDPEPDRKIDLPRRQRKEKKAKEGALRSIDPFTIPMGLNEGDYDAVPRWMIPYRSYNPYYSPVEQTQFGPVPEWKMDPRLEPASDGGRKGNLPIPGTLVAAGDPALDPRPTFEVTPSGVGVSHSKPHRPRRPGPRTREKKMAIYGRGVALALLNVTSEAEDFIDAIWKALPFKYRYDRLREQMGEVEYNRMLYDRIKYQNNHPGANRRELRSAQGKFGAPEKVTPQQKLKDIYNHHEHIDWQKAVDNLVKNELTDRFFGKIGQTAGRASRAARMSHGVQLGPTF